MTARLLKVDDLPADSRRTWAAARIWAARQAPYLATALPALSPVVVDQSDEPPSRRFDLRAFPADERWHVYVDAGVIADVAVEELGFWLLHQTAHLLRDHANRFLDSGAGTDYRPPTGGRTAEQARWNMAADAEIDDDLRAGPIDADRLPDRAITPAALGLPENWLAEQYHQALSSGDVTTEAASSDAADCGSGCDGCSRPWDCQKPGLSELERKLLGREVAHRIREHSRSRGDMPAGWQRWADEVLEPTVDWRRALASAVRRGVASTSGRVDFTYRRPSRRASVAPQFVLPSLRQPLPNIAIVIDTSGSMSDQMLGQALGEVGGVLRSVGVGRRQLRVVCCDAEAYEAQRVLDAGDVRLSGGGGTNMGAGLEAANALRPRPDIVIVFTDGHTPWPPRQPAATKVIVALMDPAGTVPAWATAVPITPAVAAGG